MIPEGTRFIGISPNVNLKERKSASINAETQPYTLDDIRGYKVYTALLTQSGGDVPSTCLGNGDIDEGFTYTIEANPDNNDLSIYGAPNNNVGTSFVANQSAFLPYTISLELSFNEGAPVVTVLENTIGNIWFTYDVPGLYNILSDNLFTDTKTTVNMFPAQFIESPEDIYNSTAIQVNDGRIALLSYYNYSVADNALSYGGPTMIEIRVYN